MKDPAEVRQDPLIVDHERTYKAFNVLLRWCMVALGSSILFLTLWFASPAGFLGALVTGVVIFALGYYFLVRDEEHKPIDVWSPDR
jgi:drug/metabolite transporter (DMT)-like permease